MWKWSGGGYEVDTLAQVYKENVGSSVLIPLA